MLIPRESNNHRPRVLHHSSLFILIAVMLVGSLFVARTSSTHPEVLGVTANISVQDLLQMTNQKRTENGLPALTLNNELANAAAAKGEDMFAKNYWAHNSPDGLTPWVFIKNAGYDYVYAGENLARGYTTASEVIDAWMASPGHRENILSPNYKEIGFSVASGTLTGDDTVLVVEEFGSRNLAGQPKDIAVADTNIVVSPTPLIGQVVTPTPRIPSTEVAGKAAGLTVTPSEVKAPTKEHADSSLVAAVTSEPLINKKSITHDIPMLVVAFFILILLLDMFLIERRKIDRAVGHNLDHVIFFTILLIAIIMVGKGLIL